MQTSKKVKFISLMLNYWINSIKSENTITTFVDDSIILKSRNFNRDNVLLFFTLYDESDMRDSNIIFQNVLYRFAEFIR